MGALNLAIPTDWPTTGSFSAAPARDTAPQQKSSARQQLNTNTLFFIMKEPPF
jgi:hypothetical protein